MSDEPGSARQKKVLGGALILMGLRGSGKTTIGRMVAERCSAPFVDLDDRVRDAFGAASIAQVFREVGEAGFRAMETKMLRAVQAESQKRTGPTVVVLGGGTPTAPGAVEILRAWSTEGARVIYLRAEAEVLGARLRGRMGDRPSLTGGDPIEEIAQVMERRDGLYRDLARTIVDAGDEASTVARRVIEAWRGSGDE